MNPGSVEHSSVGVRFSPKVTELLVLPRIDAKCQKLP
jgi:hypothetical protein